MDLEKNYYQILGVEKDSTAEQIKKKYYKLSKKLHPDAGGDSFLFSQINEAYEVLSGENSRKEWDKRSRYGKNYKLKSEFKNYEQTILSKIWEQGKFDKLKSETDLHIHLEVDEDFRGVVEYQRWITCKSCKGSGLDLRGKIIIKDEDGNILKQFENEDGCDFCEGTGKDWRDEVCSFCEGKGKTGSIICQDCSGKRRILGNQKLEKIKFPKGEKFLKIESMGNISGVSQGKSGHLFLIKKK
jgi:DnaJ-class molecular chaperone